MMGKGLALCVRILVVPDHGAYMVDWDLSGGKTGPSRRGSECVGCVHGVASHVHTLLGRADRGFTRVAGQSGLAIYSRILDDDQLSRGGAHTVLAVLIGKDLESRNGSKRLGRYKSRVWEQVGALGPWDWLVDGAIIVLVIVHAATPSLSILVSDVVTGIVVHERSRSTDGAASMSMIIAYSESEVGFESLKQTAWRWREE